MRSKIVALSLIIMLTVSLVGLTLVACSSPASTSAPAAAPAPPAAAPKPVNWVIVSASSSTSPITIGYQEMGKEIADRTGGKLTWEVHPLEELGFKGTELLQLFESGHFPAGGLGASYALGVEPMLCTGGLPFLGSAEQIPAKLNAFQPFVDKVFEKHNQVSLMHFEYPNSLWSKFEVKTIDDFRKLKTRLSDASVVKVFTKVGATAVTLASGEIYQALSTNMINSVTFSAATGDSFGFPEVTKFLYISPNINGGAYFFVVNKDALNAIPSDVQKVVLDVCKKYEPDLIDRSRRIAPDVMEKMKKKLTIVDSLDPTLVAQIIKDGANPVWDEWLKAHPETKPALDAMVSALGIKR